MIATVRPSVLFNALIVVLGFYYLIHFDLSHEARSMAMLLIPVGSLALLYHLWIKPAIQNKSVIRLMSSIMFATTTLLAASAALVHFGVLGGLKHWLVLILIAVLVYESYQFWRRGIYGNGTSPMK